MKYTILACAFSLFGSAALAAPVGAILAQGSDGNVYSVDTTTAAATLFADLDDIAGIDVNSPNGLGYNRFNGDFAFRTDFRGDSGQNSLYRNDEKLVDLPAANFSVASGHVEGDTFYYIDRQGNFVSVDGIFGAAGTQVVTDLGDVPGAGMTFGDIAIRGDDVFVSTGDLFGVFDLNAPAGGFATSLQPTQRYAGIAFSDGILYGFDANSSSLTNNLFSISLAAGTFGMATLIGEIVLDGVLLTDAAPAIVPLPSAALLLLGGLAGLATLRRRQSQVA